MNTQHIPSRYLLYFVMFALLITSCTTPAQVTRSAVLAKAQAAVNNADEASLLAGAYMVFNDVQQVAIFVTPGGGNYTFIGAVDTAHTAIMDANRVLVDFGIDITRVKTMDELKTALRTRGFQELTPGVLPTLFYALRLGLGYLKSMGASLSDVMVIPVFMMQPETIYPWIDSDWEPGVQ